LDEKGYWLSTEDRTGTLETLLDTKLYVILYISTAERLAEHFFKRLRIPVEQQSNGIGQLTNLRFLGNAELLFRLSRLDLQQRLRGYTACLLEPRSQHWLPAAGP
jgi:hypothetical protein